MKTYIGVDLGGTLVRVAKVSREGEVLYEIKSDSYAQSGPEVVLNNIVDMVKSIPDYNLCEGLGLGIPGPVDTEQGLVTLATNIKGFKDFPVAKKLEHDLGLKVFMDNDANVAALAEALVGAGKGLPVVFYITQSTGIGGGLVVNGKTVTGRSGYAGEIANIVVCESKEVINHLTSGAVENEASGTALARRGKELVSKDIETSKDLFDLATAGNQDALDLVDDMARKLAVMMANIAHVVDPHMFVLGGGVTKGKDLYFDKLITYYKTLVHPGMSDVKIEFAKLEEPGIIGAAMLPISNGL